LQNAQEKTTPTAGKLAAKIYKMRKIKLAHLKKIKKFIYISNKGLRIVDKKLLVIFLQKRASSYVIRRSVIATKTRRHKVI
jgi:hypothetical protein